jgi:integrase
MGDAASSVDGLQSGDDEQVVKIIKGETRGQPGRFILDFRDQHGRRHRETYPTYKAAKSAMADRLGEVKTQSYRSPSELPPLGEVAKAWLASKSVEGLRPATVSGYENHVHDHIVPALGDRRIDLVTLSDVERFRLMLIGEEKKLSPPTVNKVLADLRSIYVYAMAQGLVARSPMIAVKPMKSGASSEVTADDVPSAEDVAKLVAAAPTALGRTFLVAAAHTGAREGELLSLEWADVDFDARTLSIKRSDSWARTRAEREGETAVKGPRAFEPKTASGRRTIGIDDELVRELKRWRVACPRGRRGLVFPSRAGDPMHRRTLHKTAIEPAFKAAEIDKRWTVHALRHFHASALLLADIPIPEVSSRLGHRNPAITMRVYAHFIRGAESRAAAAIAGVMAAARKASA